MKLSYPLLTYSCIFLSWKVIRLGLQAWCLITQVRCYHYLLPRTYLCTFLRSFKHYFLLLHWRILNRVARNWTNCRVRFKSFFFCWDTMVETFIFDFVNWWVIYSEVNLIILRNCRFLIDCWNLNFWQDWKKCLSLGSPNPSLRLGDLVVRWIYLSIKNKHKNIFKIFNFDQILSKQKITVKNFRNIWK